MFEGPGLLGPGFEDHSFWGVSFRVFGGLGVQVLVFRVLGFGSRVSGLVSRAVWGFVV